MDCAKLQLQECFLQPGRIKPVQMISLLYCYKYGLLQDGNFLSNNIQCSLFDFVEWGNKTGWSKCKMCFPSFLKEKLMLTFEKETFCTFCSQGWINCYSWVKIKKILNWKKNTFKPMANLEISLLKDSFWHWHFPKPPSFCFVFSSKTDFNTMLCDCDL